MFSFEQIKDLIELVAQRHLQGIEVESGEFRLKIDGHRVTVTEAAAATTIVAPVAASTEPSAVEESEQPSSGVPEGAHVITSPIVGTFYGAPSPDVPA